MGILDEIKFRVTPAGKQFIEEAPPTIANGWIRDILGSIGPRKISLKGLGIYGPPSFHEDFSRDKLGTLLSLGFLEMVDGG